MSNPDTTSPEGAIPTRILILSDTHGLPFPPNQNYTEKVDVAIHCGDLTDGSKLSEFHTTLDLLRSINAPLKLVIPGNHDFTLDLPVFKQKVRDAGLENDRELVEREYGGYGAIQQMFEDARNEGITLLLEEGTHSFTLENRASLTVYASPYTPTTNQVGDWGFQYHPTSHHNAIIPSDVDVVITHGPPLGVMDYTSSRKRAGCSQLFKSIARSRPLIHCFGHIHESWGAKLVKWKPLSDFEDGHIPSHFTDIDNDSSIVIENSSHLKPSHWDTEDPSKEKMKTLERYMRQKCCMTSHCKGDERPIRKGEETLFVNAAVLGTEGFQRQFPWVVGLGLRRAKGEDGKLREGGDERG